MIDLDMIHPLQRAHLDGLRPSPKHQHCFLHYLLLLFAITTFDLRPVYNLPKRLQMRSATILIVQIIRVFPNVEGEEGLEAVGNRIVSTRILTNAQFAGFVGLEPDPAAAEEGGAFGFEFGFEGVEGTPLGFDLLFEIAGRGRQ